MIAVQHRWRWSFLWKKKLKGKKDEKGFRDFQLQSCFFVAGNVCFLIWDLIPFVISKRNPQNWWPCLIFFVFGRQGVRTSNHTEKKTTVSLPSSPQLHLAAKTVDAVNFGGSDPYIYPSKHRLTMCRRLKGGYSEGDPSQEAMANVQTCDPSHEN